MAIVRDAVSSGSNGGSGSTLTIAHTCTGSNLLLVTYVGCNTASDIITGVTYNGVAMTRATGQFIGANSISSYLYYLINPATGTHNVVISNSSSVGVQGGNTSYTGVLQTGQPDATSTASTATTATSIANAVTTVADNSIHMAGVYTSAAVPTSVTNGTFTAGSLLAESNPLAITPAGSQTMTFNGASQNWAVVGASFSPAPVVAVASPSGYAFFM